MKLKTSIAAMLLAVMGAVPSVASAHDFTATVNGQTLCFDITSKTKKRAAVTYSGSIADKKENTLAGRIEIPSKIRHNEVEYTVTAINPKAFAGAKRLKGVVIPSGVETIGDFAFEGCDSLSNIVFPANPVSFGQGVFFNCGSLSDISLGSDWTSVDFTMFRWSDKLTKILVPAKVEKIQGVKRLKALTDITVDPNNEKFAAKDGILYSKDGKTMFACPRARAGIVAVAEGTETVRPGALEDCLGITELNFPASLETLSFRETSRMKGLKSVTMKGSKPISTAYMKGKGYFLLIFASKGVNIMVPADSRKAYEAALPTEAGEYSPTPDGILYLVAADQIPSPKTLKAVKK